MSESLSLRQAESQEIRDPTKGKQVDGPSWGAVDLALADLEALSGPHTQENAPPLVRPQRVLVAEDSEVAQQVLKLLLEGRGHTVEVASDGEEALQALRDHDYDVVLMDFHLPAMDGLEVAATYRSSSDRATHPRFIAITADMEGLIAHAHHRDNFEQVFSKPLELNEICRIIESQESTDGSPGNGASSDFTPSVAISNGGPAAFAEPVSPIRLEGNRQAEEGEEKPSLDSCEHRTEPWAVRHLGYRFLHCPDDLYAPRHTLEAVNYDAILFHTAVIDEQLAPLWNTRALHALPVIDLAGSLGIQADLDASKLASGNAQAVQRLVEDFRDRRERVHRNLLMSDDLGEKLLCRLFVANRPLAASYAPNQPGLIRYNLTLDAPIALSQAEELRNSGFLNMEFIDRLHVCDRCGSSRFNVREECPDCHSSNLSEEAYLHHFKCAHQGPEFGLSQRRCADLSEMPQGALPFQRRLRQARHEGQMCALRPRNLGTSGWLYLPRLWGSPSGRRRAHAGYAFLHAY